MYLWDTLISFVCSVCRFQSNPKPQRCEMKVWIIHKYTHNGSQKASVAGSLCSQWPRYNPLPPPHLIPYPSSNTASTSALTHWSAAVHFQTQVSHKSLRSPNIFNITAPDVSAVDAAACVGLLVRLSHRELADLAGIYKRLPLSSRQRSHLISNEEKTCASQSRAQQAWSP